MDKVIGVCQQCNGKGYYETTLRDLGGREPHGCGRKAIVPCDSPTCRNGYVTEASRREYVESWK